VWCVCGVFGVYVVCVVCLVCLCFERYVWCGVRVWFVWVCVCGVG